MKRTTKYLATHLCKIDGRGYTFIVKTVKSRKAGAKFDTSPFSPFFVVTSFVA